MAKLKIKSIKGLQKKTKSNTEIKKQNKNLRILADKAVLVPIDSVKLDPENARKNDANLGKLMKLIAKYGQRTAITVNADTNVVYKGNTTWKAMKKLGYTEIAISPQTFEDKKEIVGYSLSDNKSNDWTEYDETKVAHLIKENFDGINSGEVTDFTGFTEKELLGFSYDTDELPNALEDIDISGLTEGKVDYLVIQFQNNKDMKDFKQSIDPVGKHPRVIPSEVLHDFIWSRIDKGNGGNSQKKHIISDEKQAKMQNKKKFKLKLKK